MPNTEMVVMVAMFAALALSFAAVLRLIATAIQHKTVRRVVDRDPERAQELIANLGQPPERSGDDRLSVILVAVGVLVPTGVLLGTPMPGGMRLLSRQHPDLVAWGWGMNGAFSVIGATLAVFIAMNWGFSRTLLAGAAVYGIAAVTLATRRTG